MFKTINDRSKLREIYSSPKGASLKKTRYALDEHSRRFIAASPFLILGTHGDVSPRGDNPGFVKVLDNNTLIIPDRNGNNRLDSMNNIIANPTVALIFLIPGISETFRIRGEAEISTDPILLEPLAVNKKIPMGSGLGGGSSNAAALITFINTFFKLNTSSTYQRSIAKSLGADIPFFLTGGAPRPTATHCTPLTTRG